MATAFVVRAQRYKKIGDKTSPMVNTLRRKTGDAKMYDIRRLSEEIEALGGMSAEDVEHVAKSIVRNMKEKLTDGNSVKLDGFGIFHTTFHCKATDAAKDCTIKNIDKVNIRFKSDKTFRLVNDSVASTKGMPNNIIFELFIPKKAAAGSGSDGSGSGDGDLDNNPLG